VIHQLRFERSPETLHRGVVIAVALPTQWTRSGSGAYSAESSHPSEPHDVGHQRSVFRGPTSVRCHQTCTYRFSSERKGVVHEPIKNGVSLRWLPEPRVSVMDRELTGYQSGGMSWRSSRSFNRSRRCLLDHEEWCIERQGAPQLGAARPSEGVYGVGYLYGMLLT
jgi:hypothetical protein